MNIIDLHCDTIMEFAKGGTLSGLDYTHINLDKLRKGGVMAQCFSIFVLSGPSLKDHGYNGSPEEY